jgi:hypothetical protein
MIMDYQREVYDTMVKTNANSTSFMSWIAMPQEPTSLLALFMYDYRPGNLNSTYDEELGLKIVVCTVSSYWRDMSTSLSLTSTGNLIKPSWPGNAEDIGQDDLRPITIKLEGVSKPSVVQDFPYFSGVDLSKTLVSLFAEALSWIPGQEDNTFFYSIVNKMIEGQESPSVNDPTSYTSFRITRLNTGYGYGGTGTSTQLSLAVIIAYCVITIAYVAYIIVTGHTSVAWNSATELMILALQSKEPNDLGHVSVGIDSMDTLRRSVGIRVNTVEIADTGEHMEKLELVFEHDVQDEGKGIRKVERNRAY